MRTTIVAAIGALTLTLTCPAAMAGSEDWTGGFIARDLAANGHVIASEWGPAYGPTIDAILALGATGVGGSEAAAATSYIADHIGDYVGAGDEKYSGATAKALLLARVQTGSNTLGGVDLLSRLKTLETASGRFSDQSQWGDYSNTLGHSYALIALKKAGAARSKASMDWLRLQQCPNGGFREEVAATACTDNVKSDPDATALAIEALYTAPSSTDRTSRIGRAAKYLISLQNSGGGIKGGPGQTPNANTTGLGALALKTAGKTTAAGKARSFLRSIRLGCKFPKAVRGLIDYDKATFAADSAAPASVQPDTTRRVATAQAGLGLAGVPMVKLVKPTTNATPYTSC